LACGNVRNNPIFAEGFEKRDDLRNGATQFREIMHASVFRSVKEIAEPMISGTNRAR
jgi:hypothetical protein